MTGSTSMSTPEKSVLNAAKRKAKTVKNWHELHNAIFGIGGLVSQKFPSKKERLAFSKTEECKQITDMVTAMVESSQSGMAELSEAAERSSGTLSLRLPASIHAALIVEAEREGVSLNQLIVTKCSVDLREAIAG